MALALANASRLKPEIKLSQALAEYEAVLTGEQKAQLRSYGGTVDVMAVCSLTNEIDDENKSRRSRSVGTKLKTFLESVQQFTGVIDTLAGSNKLGGLVWGAVKLAILVTKICSNYNLPLVNSFISLQIVSQSILINSLRC